MTHRCWLGSIVATAALLALASCSTSGSTFTPTAGQSTLAGGETAEVTPPVAGPTAEEAAEQVGLSEADLSPDVTLQAPAGSQEVDGQVTLDGCGYNFTTESMRVARRQVWIEPVDGELVSYSNEVVVYESPSAARLAFGQYEDSVLNCPPDKLTVGKVAGVPPLRIRLLDSELGPRSLPVRPSIVTYQRLLTETGEEMFASFIFQQRDAVLDAHYLLTAIPPTKAQRAELLRQANATGKRLAELPPIAASGTTS